MTTATSQIAGLKSGPPSGVRSPATEKKTEGMTSFAQMLMASQASSGQTVSEATRQTANAISMGADKEANRLVEKRAAEKRKASEEISSSTLAYSPQPSSQAASPKVTQSNVSDTVRQAVSTSRKETQVASQERNRENAQAAKETLQDIANTVKTYLEKGDSASQEDLTRMASHLEQKFRELTGAMSEGALEDLDLASMLDKVKALLGQLQAMSDGKMDAKLAQLAALLDKASGALEEGVDFVRIVQDENGLSKVSDKTLDAMQKDLSALKDRQLPEEFADLVNSAAKLQKGLSSAARGDQSLAGNVNQALDKLNASEPTWLSRGLDAMQLMGSANAQSKSFSDFLGSPFANSSALASQFSEAIEEGQEFGDWMNGRLSSLTGGVNYSIPKEGLAGVATATTSIREALGNAQWAEALGNRVEWIVGQKIQKATILVNPMNLGPIEVSLTVEGGKTHAMFVAQNPQVREAIEASLPQLQQMLADVGVSLGNTNVSEESHAGQQASDDGQRQSDQGLEQGIADNAIFISNLNLPNTSTRVFGQTMQLVDTFV